MFGWSVLEWVFELAREMIMCFRKFEGLADVISMKRGGVRRQMELNPISVRYVAPCFIQFPSQKASVN